MVTKIKELRTQRGMTQQQLADLVHVSSRTIISIEKGQYSPSLMLSYRMANVFPWVCSLLSWEQCFPLPTILWIPPLRRGWLPGCWLPWVSGKLF